MEPPLRGMSRGRGLPSPWKLRAEPLTGISSWGPRDATSHWRVPESTTARGPGEEVLCKLNGLGLARMGRLHRASTGCVRGFQYESPGTGTVLCRGAFDQAKSQTLLQCAPRSCVFWPRPQRLACLLPVFFHSQGVHVVHLSV